MACALAALGTARLQRADEPSPFDAWGEGRVGSGLCPGLDSLQVLVPGRAARSASADGLFTLGSLPVGRPLRVLGFAPCPASGPSLFGQGLYSAPFVLGAQGPAPSVEVSIEPPGLPPLFGLEASGPRGARRVVLTSGGQTTLLSARAGLPFGSLGELLLGGSSYVAESANSLVATVTPGGEITAVDFGVTAMRVRGDGEWAQVVVHVDRDTDTDGDGMPDSFELAHGLDPLDPSDAGRDDDSDLLTNLQEFEAGTDPRNDDTDNDLLSDGAERLLGTDPINGDSDGDFVLDGSESSQGTDPLNPNEKPGAAFTPAFRSSLNISSPTVRAAASRKDVLAVVTSDGKIIAYRISPGTFFVIFQDQEALTGTLRDVFIEEETAYVAAGTTGVHVVDLTVPAIITIRQTLGGLGDVLGVVAEKGIVYCATSAGLKVLKPGAGGALQLAGSVPLLSFSRLDVSGPLVFAAVPSLGSLVSIDVSSPDAPRELQRFAMPASASPLKDVRALGSYVYVAHGAAGLYAISARSPASLQITDSTVTKLPGVAFDLVSGLGNRLEARSPGAATRVQLFRLQDDGKLVPRGDVGGNTAGATQLLSRQEYVIGLAGGSVAVSQILASGDRGTTAPVGDVSTRPLRPTYAPGNEVTVEARARDDVYIERVRFVRDGVTALIDTIPPFRLRITLDPAVPPPYAIGVAAIGTDLAGNEAALGTAVIVVGEDRDADGTADAVDLDLDGDGVADIEERYPGLDGYVSDSTLTDSDGDGISDGEEFAPGVDGYVTNPGSWDTDLDGLSDPYEIQVALTNPTLTDSDGDGILDGDEDDDGDGLLARAEEAYGTNPRLADTDGDGLPDGLEVALGLDPLRRDSDQNGVEDGDEDLDGDGLKNREEVALGTSPSVADTDGDSLDDLTERDLGTSPVVVTDFRSSSLVFTGKTVVLRGPLAVGALELRSSTLTVPPASGRAAQPLELDVAGLLKVDAPSRINVSARGYPGGRGPGNASPLGLAPDGVVVGAEGAGGSHGGEGGAPGALPSSVSGDEYGAFDAPAFAGAGGSAASAGSGVAGAGGGVVIIGAAEVQLDGAIVADGDGAPLVAGGGGGAGGSIDIDCGMLRGTGRIDARGGAGPAGASGGFGAGGGGRVRVRYANAAGFDLTRISAGGGDAAGGSAPERVGGAGTVLLLRGGAVGGELILSNTGRATDRVRTFLGVPGEAPLVLERLRVKGGAQVSIESGLRLLGATAPLEVASGGSLHADEVIIDAPTAVELGNGTFQARRLRGEAGPLPRLQLTGARVAIEAPLEIDETILDGSQLEVSAPLTGLTLTLRSSTVTVSEPRFDRVQALELEVSGLLEVDAQSAIDVSAKGYVGGNRGGNTLPRGYSGDGEVVALAGGRTGGSHGGAGGFQSSQSGFGVIAQPVYDSFVEPQRPGSGGNARTNVPGELAYNGGGLARVRAGTLRLLGRIRADGDGRQRPDAIDLGGAGAGGSVSIDVGVLEGAGEVSADGGSADGVEGAGAGGGGRIAIRYSSRSGFTGSVHAHGGTLIPFQSKPTSTGGAGTVYWKGSIQQYGDLIVDNLGRVQSAPRTSLRRVGSGTIAALQSNNLDAPDPGFFPTGDTKLLGQWVVVSNAVTQPFRISDNTVTRLFTDPASGDLTQVGAVGAPFQGALVLDNLTVIRSAAMTTQGDLIIIATGAATIATGGSLTAPPIVHW